MPNRKQNLECSKIVSPLSRRARSCLNSQKRRKFEIEKLHLFDDPNEKHDIILGGEVYQNIGLDIVRRKQQLQWHENAISMETSGCCEDRKNTFKKRIENLNSNQIEEAEEGHDLTKISENSHKEI